MTAEQFCYWIQGFAELSNGPPSAAQWKLIQDHLDLVFNKVTPRLDPELDRIKEEVQKIRRDVGPGKIC